VSREPRSAHYVDLKQTIRVLIRNFGEWLGLKNFYILYKHVNRGQFRNHCLCAEWTGKIRCNAVKPGFPACDWIAAIAASTRFCVRPFTLTAATG